jgi:hypothetical protein
VIAEQHRRREIVFRVRECVAFHTRIECAPLQGTASETDRRRHRPNIGPPSRPTPARNRSHRPMEAAARSRFTAKTRRLEFTTGEPFPIRGRAASQCKSESSSKSARIISRTRTSAMRFVSIRQDREEILRWVRPPSRSVDRRVKPKMKGTADGADGRG